MSDVIEIPRINDLHVHLRQDGQLPHHIRHHARYADHIVAMPNTSPPLINADHIRGYEQAIGNHVSDLGSSMKAIVPLYLTEETTPAVIHACADHGVRVVKLYPRGATTGSQAGIRLSRINMLASTFKAMNERNMILSVHGEDPDAGALEGESRFFALGGPGDRLIDHCNQIVFEHLSTADGINFVALWDDEPIRVAGTITLHHLLLTTDDILGPGRLHARNFCKPVIKSAADRHMIQLAALGGVEHGTFFFGSDSAPHDHDAKRLGGAAGCWSPWIPELLVQWFDGEKHGTVELLTKFACHTGADFYGLPRPEETLRFRKRPVVVSTDDYVPVGSSLYLPFGPCVLEWAMID